MHDFDSAIWADHHLKLSDAIHQGLRDLLAGFAKLQRLRFDAPWLKRTAR